MRSKERSNMECDQEDLLQNESVFSADESITSIDENTRLRDETALLKDKVAHLQSQLEETESKSIIAAELGQRLLEERASLEAMREDDRNMYTAKIEELTQENFNLCAKLESKERLLAVHSQENDDLRKNKHEQEKVELKQSFERKINALKNELRKEKITADEEISQLNLKTQQNCEIIENLHSTIAELKAKLKNAESKSSGVTEVEELKVAFEMCYESKCEAEARLSDFIHDNERKSLEIGNFRERTREMNEQLEDRKKQYEDCSQHLEEAKDTITELRIEISQLEMELKSSGHAKKGNSLFGELEDKRVAAERNLAIFKVRYESLQKAYAVAKNEILKMKNQVLCFLQTRSDRADRMRIEHLENALGTKKAECNMLVAKLKKMESKEVESDPVKKAKEYMRSFQGNETTKDYVKLLQVNAEEFKQKIATLQKELESVRFALIGKTDQLQETQRKLYTATNTSEKHRNESLRAKLKLDELKNKFEAEKRKKTELEALVKKLESGDVERTSPTEHGTEENVKEKKVILPKYLQDANKEKEDRKRKAEKSCQESKRSEADGIGRISESDLEPKRPTRELTDEEKKAKCYRLLMNTLPKELAEECVKGYKQEEKMTELHKENHVGLQRRERMGKNRTKSRKVSFKDEVDHLGDDEKQQSPEKKDPDPEQDHANVIKETVFAIDNEKPESKVVIVEENKQDACHVQ